MSEQRKIIHVDMDAFFAAVEQRDHPELRGKPVIVGGDPNSRGVVATCSYEARKFGIHSAMAASQAYRLCPQAVFVRPHFDAYRAVSQQIRTIFADYTDQIEPLSIDEAFLDVSANKMFSGSATLIAQQILATITRHTGLTASAGVSYNKFLAKVASDCNKPNGLTVITPQQADAFIAQLPIRRFFGVGKVTEKRMLAHGIATGADLRKCSRLELQQLFGKSGDYYYQIARGIDLRPVTPNRIRKSIGKETTLQEDIDDCDLMLEILNSLALRIEAIAANYNTSARTVTLKLKFADFRQTTLSHSPPQPVNNADAIMAIVAPLLRDSAAGQDKVRLLGISLSNLDLEKPLQSSEQLLLPFDDAEPRALAT
ncbi:MAG: DNA polymerase IV [Desulfuromonas sp.]|nr:DNA polymerase IV [Desulfuromonas sp.]